MEKKLKKSDTERKILGEISDQGEQCLGLKLENDFSSSQKTKSLELFDIIDVWAIQPLMDEFYKLTHIPIGINDLKGNVLVNVGWQDICAKFHRVHPETSKHCIESDTKLSSGVTPGKFKLYKCKNNMWDMTTPIIVSDQYVGYVFSGQFFFKDESVDYELFRSQAKKYSFNEEEYIAALDKVPRLSREAVHTGMAFLMTFANMISQLSYSNIKLAHSLEERDTLVEALRKSERREQARSEELEAVLDAVPVAVFITNDPLVRQLTGNRLSYEWLGVPVGTNFSKSAPERERPEMFNLFKDGREIPPEKMPSQMAAAGREVNDCELDIVSTDGSIRHVLGNARPLRDEQGDLRGSVSAFIDITERNRAEEALRKAHQNLEEKIKERTAELEKAYNSLKESERGLAEAQKMAHIGSWDWNLKTDQMYWSDEMYRIFGCNPQEGITYKRFLGHVHPEYRDYVCNSTKDAFNGKVYATDYRIVRPDGEERIVHSEREVIFEGGNNPVRMRGTVQDVTDHKKSEEKIRNFASIVESSNDAIGTISLDNIIMSWNEEAEHVYGYSAEEIIGKQTSVLAPLHLEKETSELCKMIKQGEKIRHHETSRLRKGGNMIDVSITLSPVFDSRGELTAISFISRDITERKRVEEKLRENEEKYRNIVETANEGIITINDKAIITYANKKITDMLGYSQEEGIGRPIWDFISEESRTIAKQNLERRQKGINGSYELKLIHKDGFPIWAHINAKPLFEKNGRFIGSLSMLTDITKRREAEEALANIGTARKQEIHHRIKNNLQVISSLLDLQAEKFKNREDIKLSEILEAFRESQDRVMSIALIHEELHEGRGEDSLNFSLYLQRLLQNLFQTYRFGDTEICLNLDLEENIFFDMDTAVPLGMIVNELVSNSLKYAFSGKKNGEIQIKLFSESIKKNLNSEEQFTQKDIKYTIIVSDNGVGISEKINFEDSDTLGLQLVNLLVDQLDGTIELKRDNGAEFVLKFSAMQ